LERFAQLCFEVDQHFGEPRACRHFLNWFDDTPREQMRRELLPEVVLALVARGFQLPGAASRTRTLCRHCRHRSISRSRHLCFICYNVTAIRVRYPPTARTANRGIGLGDLPEKLPTSPTMALPGTEAKLTVMEERARRCEMR
jgi:hypothetical protein